MCTSYVTEYGCCLYEICFCAFWTHFLSNIPVSLKQWQPKSTRVISEMLHLKGKWQTVTVTKVLCHSFVRPPCSRLCFCFYLLPRWCLRRTKRSLIHQTEKSIFSFEHKYASLKFHHASVVASLGKTASIIKDFTDRNTDEYSLF